MPHASTSRHTESTQLYNLREPPPCRNDAVTPALFIPVHAVHEGLKRRKVRLIGQYVMYLFMYGKLEEHNTHRSWEKQDIAFQQPQIHPHHHLPPICSQAYSHCRSIAHPPRRHLHSTLGKLPISSGCNGCPWYCSLLAPVKVVFAARE